MTLQNFLKRSANRVAFEADKLQHTMKVQNAISRLQTQVRSQTLKLGQTALELYHQGGLAEAELLAIAQAIAALEKQMAEQEAELARIKAETLPEPEEEMPSPPRQSAQANQFCPQCGQALPPEIRFCVHCGSKLEAVAG